MSRAGWSRAKPVLGAPTKSKQFPWVHARRFGRSTASAARSGQRAGTPWVGRDVPIAPSWTFDRLSGPLRTAGATFLLRGKSAYRGPSYISGSNRRFPAHRHTRVFALPSRNDCGCVPRWAHRPGRGCRPESRGWVGHAGFRARRQDRPVPLPVSRARGCVSASI